MKDILPVLLAAIGTAAWSLLLAVRTGAFSLFYPGSLWGERPPPPPAEDLLPLFFLTATSWLGAWLTVYSTRFLAPHRREAGSLAKLGVIQALLPLTTPLLPIAYLALLKRRREERLVRLTQVDRVVEQ